jgi:SAM-dependent methyltransferase
MKLDSREIVFHPLSVGTDGYSRVFWWEGELYRAIKSEQVPFYIHLLSDGIRDALSRRNLIIETEATELKLDGYALVLKHRTVPFVSYCYEWCGEMLKAAALSVLELQKELLNHGLALVDLHPWNVLFAGTTPLWVDLGSILPARSSDPERAYEEFSSYYTRPLRIMAAGHEHVAHCLFRDPYHGVAQYEAEAFTGSDLAKIIRTTKKGAKSAARRVIPSTIRPYVRRAAQCLLHPARDPISSIEIAVRKVETDIEKINLVQRLTKWSGYYDIKGFLDFASTTDWTEKHHSIRKILSAKWPKSVLDIGSNSGWYSQLAARNGAQVVGLDVDEPAVTKLFLDAARDKLCILPLVSHFHSLNPAMAGPGVAPAERLRCDMVLALALVHNLVISLDLPFETIIRDIAALTGKWLVIEYVGPEDIYMREEIRDHWYYSCYTFANFLAVLRKEFRKIR